jgi:WD40 repeat protein/DNA-binding SARP family transcriptional activator
MRFLVLGPLEVIGATGEPIPIAGSKERTVLAGLISRAGRVVSLDDLIEDLWGEQPPRTAEKTLGSYVSRLRRALEPTSDLIVTRGNGYALEVAADEIDSLRFEELAEQGRRLLDVGRSDDAGSALDEALGLWRGSAYQDYRYTGFGTSEGERLEELRRSAEEDFVDTRIASGDESSLIADLEAMVRAEPLRERRWAQLMLALYRAGRQAEALRAFSRARSVLVDELGIDPGPELSRLQTAILAQDPALEEPWSGPRTQMVSSTDVCPYKGLARFETSDAAFYFGREQIVTDAVGHLVSERFLAFVGASGCGKSSILRAGLLHALESGAIPGSDRWSYAVMRPGDHPIKALASALDVPAPHEPAEPWNATRRVVVVDQFEEIFTACEDEAERAAFLDAITEAALHPEGKATIVLAMRADYYGRCAEHDALASLVAGKQIMVGPMKAKELRRAIELPAERAGLRVEERLIDALTEHTVNQPGGLPLLSTALLELWTRRHDQTLHLDDYLRSGGVEGAVARMAEHAFGGLDRNEQAAAKRILIRLAGSGDGTEVVGRAAPLSEFDLERDTDASRAMAALTEARLITVAEGTVEVAHEALLRDWPRLRGWLEDDAEGRRLRSHVTESARAWDEGGRDDGDLYRGARLTSALDWGDEHVSELNTAERAFLEAGRGASEGESARARRTNRRLRALLAGVVVLLVLSLIVGDLALGQRDKALAAADVADARQLAARSLAERDQTLSLLLAREAVALDDTSQTRSALLTALQHEPAALAQMHANGSTPGDQTQWLRLSPDGSIIASGGARTTVDLFDAATYQMITDVQVGAPTTTGDFSENGATLAVATTDRQIVGIDVRDGNVVARVTTADRGVDAVLFMPEGGSLLTAESDQREQAVLVQRDPETLEPSRPPVRTTGGAITAMDSSADGRWLVTTGFLPGLRVMRGRTALWDARELEQLRPYNVGGNDVALSPDGRTAAIAAAQRKDRFADPLKGHLVLLDLQTGHHRTSHELGSEGSHGLTGVVFSPDGRSVLSTGDDGRVLIWNASRTRIEGAFDDPAHLSLFNPVLSPSASVLFTIDADGNIAVWGLGIDKQLGRPFVAGPGAGLEGGLPWFAISPDGGTLAILQTKGESNGSVRLVDTSTMEHRVVIAYDRYAKHRPEAFAFSPNGRTLAISSLDYIRLWDSETGAPDGPAFQVPVSEPDTIDFWALAFSPDGSRLATAGVDWDTMRTVVFLWDVESRGLIEQLPEQEHPVSSLSFTPDGRLLVMATGFDDGAGDAIVWDEAEGRVATTIPADDTGLWWTDISDDGTTLVTGGESSGQRLWDLSTGTPIGPGFASDQVDTVDLSPDGRTLVAAGEGWVTMRDVSSGAILGRSWFPSLGSDDRVAAMFSPPDGHRLFIVSETGDAWVWDVDPASWEARACLVAGRSLTEAEWQANLPDRPYNPTCAS